MSFWHQQKFAGPGLGLGSGLMLSAAAAWALMFWEFAGPATARGLRHLLQNEDNSTLVQL